LLNKYIKWNFGSYRCGTSTIVDVRRLKVKRRRENNIKVDVKKNETQVSGLGSSGAGQGHMAALLHRALNSTSCKISGIS